VAAVAYLPLSGLDSSSGFYVEGRPAPARADEQQTHYRSVSSGYFDAMSIGLVAGRPFTVQDRARSSRVAIINEAMANRYWLGENPIGRRMALDFEAMKFFPDKPPVFDIAAGMREIVGVVRNVRHDALRSNPSPELYVPYLHRPVNDMTLVVRTSGDPEVLGNAARAALGEIDPTQPITQVETLSNLVARSIAQPRMNVVLLSIFAAIAITLAVVGLYGLAYVVAQRTFEWGIRLALGGQPSDVRRLVLRQGGGQLIAIGLLCGIPLAWIASQVLRRLLFGVEPGDPATIGASVVILGVSAFVGCYLPARRATRVDPAVALRTN
jgi:putative ABC transport system permease protein